MQGISEWLPISSKTQVLISSQYLLGLSYQQAYTFGLFMEIGTVIAAVIYFRRELWYLIQALLGSRDHMKRKLLIYVVVATIVTAAVAVPLYKIADSITGVSVGIPMLVIGLVLVGDALFIRYSRKRSAQGARMRKFASLGWKEYIIIGFMQGIAALPGVSRSGITTSTMLVLNVEPDEAFRLSFLIGIFAAVGAFGVTLIFSKSNVTAALAGISAAGLAIAIVTATIVSLFLIDFLFRGAGKAKLVYVTAGLGLLAFAAGLVYLLLGA